MFYLTPNSEGVSNLVVMDLARKQVVDRNIISFFCCFKPCCNGFSSEALLNKQQPKRLITCFKPCCNGFSSEAYCLAVAIAILAVVSNLVVMDLARKHGMRVCLDPRKLGVSNLVVMDLARKPF